MPYKAIGLSFLAIGAFLLGVKHIAAAIYQGSDLPINAVSYRELEGMGAFILVLAAISTALGAFYWVKGIRQAGLAGDDE